MEIPKPVLFDVYVGTLVLNAVLDFPKTLSCPFVVVVLCPISRSPLWFMSNADTFENAAIDMDDIQYEGMKHSQSNIEYTVLEMRYKGDTVVWTDRMPFLPVSA